MYLASHSVQLQTVFGGGYVAEQHNEATHRYLPAAEPHEFVMDFDAVLKALRAAIDAQILNFDPISPELLDATSPTPGSSRQ